MTRVMQELKWLVNNFRGRKEWSQLENAEYIAAAVVSKTLATAATYPFQVQPLAVKRQPFLLLCTVRARVSCLLGRDITAHGHIPLLLLSQS